MSPGAFSADRNHSLAPRRETPNANKIAIVGMSCLFPGAPDLASFWANIVGAVDSIRDVGEAEWSEDYHYRQNKSGFEHIYCKRGGFITEHATFDPLKFGVMPNSIEGFDPDQLLALRVASEALADAGWDSKNSDGARAEVILGRTAAPGGGTMNMVQRGETVKEMMAAIAQINPELTAEQLQLIKDGLLSSLRNCNSDTIPGQMPNILAGRIAGRFNFRGRSLVLDAACASSLIAVEIAVQDLLNGSCDLALAGGVHVNAFACFYEMFCGLGALSRKQIIRPFDQEADGTMLGEGLGMVVLKRYEQAVTDGDRIYATICGIASACDGHGTSMLAPSAEGEALAMTRAYEIAQIDPRTVSLLEAHGTGTPSGDAAELRAVARVFGSAETGEPWCALGSIKSMIGHCQAASGVAGLIKTVLALYHKILPPTLNVENPTAEIDWATAPCYVNSEARTWINPTLLYKAEADKSAAHAHESYWPRRAAVSAFGFGGVNAHVVLEEIEDLEESTKSSLLLDWETEVCIFRGNDTTQLIAQAQAVHAYLQAKPAVKLKDVAFTLSVQANEHGAGTADKAGSTGVGRESTLAIVASSNDDLLVKLGKTIDCLKDGREPSLSGVFYTNSPRKADGKLAFVLPGLGAAYPNMLADLCLHLPDVRACFDFVDELAVDAGDTNLPSRKVFPRPFGASESSASLAGMDSAVVTVLLTEWALYTVLKRLEIHPDALLGCSTGEFAAICMSGAVDLHSAASLFYRLSTKTARSVSKDRLSELRTIVVAADYDAIAHHLNGIDELYLGASLSPHQTMISGSRASIKQLSERLTAADIEPQPLPMAIPYHTPLVEGVVDVRNEEIQQLPMSPPAVPAWSCSTMAAYPADPEVIRKITTELFTHPIMLKKTVESMYEEGVRIFLEVGPKGVLTPMIADTLDDRPHLAVAVNSAAESSITQLNYCLAELAAHGVHVNLNYLFNRRRPSLLDFANVPRVKKPTALLNLSYPAISLPDSVAQRIVAERHAAIPLSQSTAAPVADTAAGDAVLSGYLTSMSQFHENLMGMQEQLMRAYLVGADEVSVAGADLAFAQADSTYRLDNESTTDNAALPLLQNGLMECVVQGGAVRAEVLLTLDGHRYLLDHAIGGAVSQIVQAGANLCQPERVYLLPLTVALEVMAEAASIVCPQQMVLRFRDVRAVKRIRVGSSGCHITVTAQPIVPTSQVSSSGYTAIACEILINDEAGSSKSMSCIVDFADALPAPPAIPQFVEPFTAPSIKPENLYTSETMFHGQRMQSVMQLDAVSRRVISGLLSAREAADWFPQPGRFLTDPLLLDNATHLVLYHLYEHQENVTALLPFLVESVELYCQLPALRGVLRSTAVMNSSTKRGTEADVYIHDDGGHVLAQFNGISSRRISLDAQWKDYVANPLGLYLSREIPQLERTVAEAATAMLPAGLIPEDEVTTGWCLDYVLHAREQSYYQSLPNAQRRREWLSGRIAVKEAVRRLLARQGLFVCSADVLIDYAPSGQPIVLGRWQSLVPPVSISLTHKLEMAAAVASFASAAGIDIEELAGKESGFEKLAMLPHEVEFLNHYAGGVRQQLIIQMWSAKEAVGKALGTGMAKDPRTLSTAPIGNSMERIQVTPAGGATPYVVHSLVQENFVLSCTLLEPVYSSLNA